jgi:phospholipase/carboxylesterase
MNYRTVETAAAVRLMPAAATDCSVIWLHGLGADGHDFVPLVPELRLPPPLAPRFVFPHARPRPITVNGGAVMRAWYDIVSLGSRASSDEAGIRASVTAVETFIHEERSAGIAANRIVLAGFSQGGVIALHAALRHREALAGVLALSTYLPLPETLQAEAAPENRQTPILMCHGRADEVLPLSLGTLASTQLRALGYAVEWREYPMGHALCAPEVAAIAAWLIDRLAGGAAPARSVR